MHVLIHLLRRAVSLLISKVRRGGAAQLIVDSENAPKSRHLTTVACKHILESRGAKLLSTNIQLFHLQSENRQKQITASSLAASPGSMNDESRRSSMFREG